MTTKQNGSSTDDRKPFHVSLISSLITLSIAVVPAVAAAQSGTTTATTSPYKATPAEIESIVRGYFSDIPVMIEIARCESRFRQFTDAGNPLDGGVGGMIGVYQIARNIHTNAAKALGFDIDTVEGNLGYARHLYTTEGTKPWLSSFQCWNTGNVENTTTSTTNIPTTNTSNIPAAGTLTSDLSFGQVHPEVLLLQQILNKTGFTVATEGPGSSGNETNKYGFLTREAVKKFQCAQKIVCEGDEYSTGYGFVGKRTRAALLTVASGPISSAPVSTPTTGTPKPTAAEIADIKTKIEAAKKLLSDLEAELKVKEAQAAGN